MQLKPHDIPRHLQRNLLPAYLVAGDEPLLIQESVDALRAAARAQGYDEREVLEVEPGFEWERLQHAAGNLSLFSERRLIELRLPDGKPGAEGARALQDYCAKAPPDTLLLVISGRLPGKARQSAWVKALEGLGALVYCWPVGPREFPGWLRRRLQHHGLQPSDDAIELLVARSEGNLLAANQEVEKLALLHGQGPLDGDTVAAAVADSARYDLNDLGDAMLTGDRGRAWHVLQGLREEGTAAPLVLWAVARDLRAVADLRCKRPAKPEWERFLRGHGIFRPRVPRIAGAARRGQRQDWLHLLSRCAEVDRTVKGVGEGRAWDELARVVDAAARLVASG